MCEAVPPTPEVESSFEMGTPSNFTEAMTFALKFFEATMSSEWPT